VRTEAEGELGRNEANQRARLHRVEEGRRVLDLISKAVNAGQGRSKPSTHAEVVAQNLFTTIVIMAEQGESRTLRCDRGVRRGGPVELEPVPVIGIGKDGATQSALLRRPAVKIRTDEPKPEWP